MTIDVWNWTVGIFEGRPPAAPSRWPASLTRRIVAPPDREPDLELPAEPLAAVDIGADVLAVLSSLGEATVRELADALHVPRQTTWRRLDALRRAGRVDHDGRAWAVS